MREVTKQMIKRYLINKLGYDFMGYQFQDQKELSFHHLIVPKRLCPLKGYGDGYYQWNGAILVQNTAHNYLHIIERYDRDMFEAITKQMIKENRNGKIDVEQLQAIDDILRQFEKQYSGLRTRKEKPLIREEYTKRLIKR